MSSLESSAEQNFGSVEVNGFKECHFYIENLNVGSDLSQRHFDLDEKKRIGFKESKPLGRKKKIDAEKIFSIVLCLLQLVLVLLK